MIKFYLLYIKELIQIDRWKEKHTDMLLTLNRMKKGRGEKMELVALITIAMLFIIIFVYLILTDTDCLQIMKQIREIARLRIENDELKDINADLREEHNSYVLLKYDYEKTLRSTIIDLLDIQDISGLGISEEEKNKNRKVIIDKIIKDFSNKINELDNSRKVSSSK